MVIVWSSLVQYVYWACTAAGSATSHRVSILMAGRRLRRELILKSVVTSSLQGMFIVPSKRGGRTLSWLPIKIDRASKELLHILQGRRRPKVFCPTHTYRVAVEKRNGANLRMPICSQMVLRKRR